MDRTESTYILKNITAPTHENKGDNYSVTTEEYHYYSRDTEYLSQLLTIGLKYTDHIIGEQRAGFRSGKSTTDQIFKVKNAVKSSALNPAKHNT